MGAVLRLGVLNILVKRRRRMEPCCVPLTATVNHVDRECSGTCDDSVLAMSNCCRISIIRSIYIMLQKAANLQAHLLWQWKPVALEDSANQYT